MADKFMVEHKDEFTKLKDELSSSHQSLEDQVKVCKETVAKPAKVLVVEAMMLTTIVSMRVPAQRDTVRPVLVDQVNTVNKGLLDISEGDIHPALWAESLKTLGQ